MPGEPMFESIRGSARLVDRIEMQDSSVSLVFTTKSCLSRGSKISVSCIKGVCVLLDDMPEGVDVMLPPSSVLRRQALGIILEIELTSLLAHDEHMRNRWCNGDASHISWRSCLDRIAHCDRSLVVGDNCMTTMVGTASVFVHLFSAHSEFCSSALTLPVAQCQRVGSH